MTADFTCPGCGHHNPGLQKYCGECGNRLPAGSAVGPATPPQDAASLERHGERKQVTVLFCDIVGSTSLAAGLGEDRMHLLVNEFLAVAMQAVHRFEGSVNQFLGDGFMALFGAPIAHEDHARRAALAALDIQGAMLEHTWSGLPGGASLQSRIGMHTGPVVFGRIGDSLRMDVTAIGDTANVAARLQGEALPGTIVCSDVVARAIREHVECLALGERMLKGKSNPVAVFRLMRARRELRPADPAIGDAPGATLLGRADELRQLQQVVAALALGQGGVLSILGDAGVGKSRLLAEARLAARRSRLDWVEGSCVSFGKSMSYWPFRGVVRTCLGIAEDAGEKEAARLLDAGLRRVMGEQADECLPFVACLLGLSPGGNDAADLQALDAQAIGHQIFRSCLRLFTRLAQSAPLAVVFEDWHWADSSSAELLEHLLPLTARVPLLLVIAMRPEPQGAAQSLMHALEKLPHPRPQMHSLALLPLSDEAAQQLAARLFGGGTLPPHLEAHLLRQAGGNPFYLGELARALLETQAVEREPATDTWRTTARFDPAALPDTIEGVILARVDRLDESSKQLLKAAAVIGRSFIYRVLTAVAAGTLAIDHGIARLKTAELVEENGLAAELELMFRHPLIQQAAYGSLLEDGRRRLHRLVGQAYEALYAERLEEFYPVLAHHYARAEDWERAQEYLLKAAEQAGRIAADAEALEHYAKALRAAEASARSLDPIRHATLGTRMAEALFRLGRHDAALELALSALAGMGIAYPASRRATYLAIARKIVAHGARRIGRIGRRHASQPEDERYQLQMQLLEVIGNIDYYRNPPRFALSMLNMLTISATRPLSRARVVSTAALGLICDTLGLARIAGRLHAKAIAQGEQLGDSVALGYAQQLFGLFLYGAGDWQRAHATLADAAGRLETARHLRLWASAIGGNYFVLRSMGDPRWIELAQRQLEVAQDTHDAHAIAWATNSIGVVHLYRGDFHAAMAHFEKACAAYQVIPDYRFLSGSLARWGHCLALSGRFDDALGLLARSRAVVRDNGIRGLSATAAVLAIAEGYLAVAELAPEGHARRDAFAQARLACRAATRHGRRLDDESGAEALRLNGVYAWLAGDHPRATRLWHQCTKVADKMGARRCLALAHFELGRRAADPAHARVAEALFASTGSAPLLADSSMPGGRGGA